MILGAGLLVLAGLGLLIAGVVTGVTALYWACVAVCLVAAVLLFLVRRQITAATEPEEMVEPMTRTVPATTYEPETTDDPATADEPAAGAATTDEPATTVEAAPADEPKPKVEATARRESAPETSAPEDRAAEPARATATAGSHGTGHDDRDEPPLEEVEVTDLLLVVDLHDEVLVIDEHPRYHVAGCGYLSGRTTIPLPLDEARGDGFTPCGRCQPDRTLADRARTRRAAGSN